MTNLQVARGQEIEHWDCSVLTRLPVDWRCMKQTAMALSSAGVEYAAMFKTRTLVNYQTAYWTPDP